MNTPDTDHWDADDVAGATLQSSELGRPDLLPDGIPAPHAPLAFELARAAKESGHREEAVAWLQAALRDGEWTSAYLWSELVSLIDRPEDFERIRDLWLSESPPSSHHNVAVLRALAHGASLAGRHAESRALLRKAILTAARRRSGPKAALRATLARAAFWRTAKRRTKGQQSPTSAPPSDAGFDKANSEVEDREHQDTALYFSLLDAVVQRDRRRKKRIVGLLRDLDGGAWLRRL